MHFSLFFITFKDEITAPPLTALDTIPSTLSANNYIANLFSYKELRSIKEKSAHILNYKKRNSILDETDDSVILTSYKTSTKEDDKDTSRKSTILSYIFTAQDEAANKTELSKRHSLFTFLNKEKKVDHTTNSDSSEEENTIVVAKQPPTSTNFANAQQKFELIFSSDMSGKLICDNTASIKLDTSAIKTMNSNTDSGNCISDSNSVN